MGGCVSIGGRVADAAILEISDCPGIDRVTAVNIASRVSKLGLIVDGHSCGLYRAEDIGAGDRNDSVMPNPLRVPVLDGDVDLGVRVVLRPLSDVGIDLANPARGGSVR